MNSSYILYHILNGISSFALIPTLIYWILLTVGKWKIFEKAGVEGWKSIIPFYSNYLRYQIAVGQGLLFLVLLVPVVGPLMNIYMYYQLCRDFGKEPLFTVLTILFPGIFLIILGFNEDAYTYPDNYFTRRRADY